MKYYLVSHEAMDEFLANEIRNARGAPDSLVIVDLFMRFYKEVCKEFPREEELNEETIRALQAQVEPTKYVKETIDELNAKQQPLGDKFEKVLHDNLFELYADGKEKP